MEQLRIVFMGTPEFAVGILETIIKNNYNVVGVITAADKPAGRGQKIKYSAVKEYALTNNLPLLQPTNLKDEGFLAELKAQYPGFDKPLYIFEQQQAGKETDLISAAIRNRKYSALV